VRYSVDTSALLDGWRRHYPPDVFPGLWTRLEDLIGDGQLRATEEVLQELKRKDDEVHEWAKRQSDFFIPIDEVIQPVVSSILASFEKLVDTRANRSACDPFVIALAQSKRCAVVTGEKATGSPDRPHIPDVCRALDVRCMSLLDLIREQGWTF
jgi:hypothetical protein